MIVHYNCSKDEKILTNERLINKHYNKAHANRIKSRITELQSANNLNEIPQCPPPRRHKLSSNMQNCWGIDYSPNYRIIVEPYGSFDINDLTTITEIKILRLEDYH